MIIEKCRKLRNLSKFFSIFSNFYEKFNEFAKRLFEKKFTKRHNITLTPKGCYKVLKLISEENE